jgi:hypothetical protein
VGSVGRVWRVVVCMFCACDSEDREHGVVAGVNTTILSETLQDIILAESAGSVFQLRKPVNLCRKEQLAP